MDKTVFLVALVLVAGGVLVTAAAPTATACGFNETFTEGPVETGLECTRPYVRVNGDAWPTLP